MDVIGHNPHNGTERALRAGLPRLQTMQLTPVLRGQRRQSRLSQLFVGLQRSLSSGSAPSPELPSPLSPATRRAPWPAPVADAICAYFDLSTLLQVRLVDRTFDASACRVIAARHIEAVWPKVLPKLMAYDVRLQAAALRRDRETKRSSALEAPMGRALLVAADRLALRHAEAEGWERRGRWQTQMLLSAKLFDCPNLTKLHLSCHGPMPSQSMVRFLGNLRQLQYLSLAGGDFTGYDLAHAWARLADLQTLALSNLRAGAIDALLETHPKLAMLRLAYTPGVSEQTIRIIASMPRLRTLELIGNDLDDASLAPLRGARALKHLDISYNKWLTPGAIMQVAPKTRHEPLRLQQLIIAGVPIDETSAAAVATMGFLDRLWAPDSHMTPWGVRIISQTRQLEMAALRGQILFPRGNDRTTRRGSEAPSVALQPQNRRLSLTGKRRDVLCDVPSDALDDSALGPLFFRVLSTGWTQPCRPTQMDVACSR